jgi:hypothetical protein
MQRWVSTAKAFKVVGVLVQELGMDLHGAINTPDTNERITAGQLAAISRPVMLKHMITLGLQVGPRLASLFWHWVV